MTIRTTPPVSPMRRRTLLRALAAAGLAAGGVATRATAVQGQLLHNVTGLYPVRVSRIATPRSTADVAHALRSWPGQVAVGGARFSMGGQIGVEGGLHLDMRGMDRVVWLDPGQGLVRVQAGLRWRDLQDHLDPHGLAVRTMQSYSNFTVGGSVSVNAHGRYVGHGPVGHSVRALQLVLADGRVVEACRSRHADLFSAAIGGYGAIGVITEVELRLDRNGLIERTTAQVRLEDYPGYFRSEVQGGACLLHNADLVPPAFDVAHAVSWSPTRKPPTVEDRLVPRGQDYALEQAMLWAVSELPKGDKLQRKVVRPALARKPAVVWRNYEASLDVASLEPKSRASSTYVLQEYFVPVARFGAFVQRMAEILRRRRARVLNVSVRHSPADRDAILAWAREEVFSFVLYYKQGVDAEAAREVGEWTRELIDVALSNGGTYYLPYQRHATQAQFDAAYPRKAAFKEIKAKADPGNRLSNELWRQYL